MAFDRFLKNTLENDVGEAVYERGMEYFRSGHVKKIWLEDSVLHATVIGSQGSYQVKIVDINGEFDFSCTCPFEGNFCKHAVATGLTFLAQKRNYHTKTTKAAKDQDEFKEQLLQFEKDDIANLLLLSLKIHKDWKSTLLKEVGKLLEKKGIAYTDSIYEEQFLELLQRASGIIDEHNEYGGGPDEDYDEVYEASEEIVQLFKEKKLNEELKREFINTMIHYYMLGNHGMVDMVIDAAYDVAETRENWEQIIQKLQVGNDRYRQGRIMDIYKDKLHDEQTYLKMRQSQLQYGLDYYELVKFYQEKGDIDKAIQIAKTGIEKGEGRIIDLLEFLFEFYKKQSYGEAFVYAKKIFKDEPGLHRYKWLKEFAKSEDWKELDGWCRKQLREYDLAHVHLENKEYDKVLAYVLEKPTYYGMSFDSFENKKEFAKQLISIYPKEMLEYYKEKVDRFLKMMGRDSYQRAAEYAQDVKDIYQNHLHQNNEWKTYLDTIRTSNPKKPALLEEFSKL